MHEPELEASDTGPITTFAGLQQKQHLLLPKVWDEIGSIGEAQVLCRGRVANNNRNLGAFLRNYCYGGVHTGCLETTAQAE